MTNPTPDVVVINPNTPDTVIVGAGQGGAQGPIGPAGPAGTKGDSGGFFTYTQNTPASTWNITHNLGYNPAVSIIDSSGSQVEGSVTWVSNNSLSVTFSAAFSGVAYLS
jgi:hypothetical protein